MTPSWAFATVRANAPTVSSAGRRRCGPYRPSADRPYGGARYGGGQSGSPPYGGDRRGTPRYGGDPYVGHQRGSCPCGGGRRGTPRCGRRRCVRCPCGVDPCVRRPCGGRPFGVDLCVRRQGGTCGRGGSRPRGGGTRRPDDAGTRLRAAAVLALRTAGGHRGHGHRGHGHRGLGRPGRGWTAAGSPVPARRTGWRAPVTSASSGPPTVTSVRPACTPARSSIEYVDRRWRGMHQRDDGARLAGPRRTAGAVQVVLGVLRRVDVHDERDAVDVDAACRDVRRDEHVHPTLAELGQRAGAYPLGLAAVQGAGADADRGELLGQPVDGHLGAHEHDRAAVRARRSTAMMSNFSRGGISSRWCSIVVDGGAGRVDLVRHRVVQEALDQRVDVAVERGREQQPLAAAPASAPAAR